MEEINELMAAKISKGKVVIEIPIDLLKHTQEWREDSIKIRNKKEMSDWVVENILEWGGNQDLGSTAFEDFIDAMFIEALENGEEWLDWVAGEEE
jgi:hypothetical protein